MHAATLMITTIEAVEPELETADWQSDQEVDPKALWDLISRTFRKRDSVTELFNELLDLRVDKNALSITQFLSRFRHITGSLAAWGVPVAPAFKAVLLMRAIGAINPCESTFLVLEMATELAGLS